MIGAGGVHPPPEGYIQGVADLCAEHGILLVIDSVICGFGRLGTWFGVERWEDIRPAMITFAKGVSRAISRSAAWSWGRRWPRRTSGRARRADVPPRRDVRGPPVACAAALAVLDIYEKESLIPRGRSLEKPLFEALAGLESHPAVAEVRGGLGFLAAVGVHDGCGVQAGRGARDAVCSCGRFWAGRGFAAADLRQEHIELVAGAIRAGLDDVAGM